MNLERLFNLGIPILSGILLILIVTLNFLQIVLRESFNFSLNWSDEVAQFCMMWMSLFGSIYLTKNNLHLNTGLKLHKKLNKRLICLIDSILALGIAVITAVVAYRSSIFSFKSMNISVVSLPWLKMGYIFIALPIAMMAMCYYNLKNFIINFVFIFKKD
jgi:TRAP-type C4-dicarboxylate transport system permease small subunit